MVPRSSSSQSRPLRILLVDDHPIICNGLKQLIESAPNLLVCGGASERNEALQCMARTHPDLAIVDLGLRGSSGLDLIKDTRSQFPSIGLLVLSVHDESLYGERCIRAGARGYLDKRKAPELILGAIRIV